jgi:hypothetical protein
VAVQTDDFAQLQLQFVDRIQWRYEVIRPMVLLSDTVLIVLDRINSCADQVLC